MTIRPTGQPKKLQDTARPKVPTIPNQTAQTPTELEFIGMIDNGGYYSIDHGELDNRFFDESWGHG